MRRKSDTRFFTVEEATRTLPLVSRIMADIVEENDRLQELLPTLKEVRIRARRNPAAAEELESLRADVAVISTRLEGYLSASSRVHRASSTSTRCGKAVPSFSAGTTARRRSVTGTSSRAGSRAGWSSSRLQ